MADDAEMLRAQVISFEIHNPHAQTPRCAYGRGTPNPCYERATWGFLASADDEGFMTMFPLCERHVRMSEQEA